MRAAMKKVIKTCVICGKQFRPMVPNQKTCDEVCRAQYKYYHPKGEHKGQCQYCGKPFVTRQKRKFCNDICREKFHHNERVVYEEAECPVCRKMFKRSTKKQKYCSDRCREINKTARDAGRKR